MLETVLYSLRLFVVGGGAHLYTKCHGRTQHYLLDPVCQITVS